MLQSIAEWNFARREKGVWSQCNPYTIHQYYQRGIHVKDEPKGYLIFHIYMRPPAN